MGDMKSLSVSVILMSLACIFRQSLASPAPTPTPWPHQFHSRLWVNNTGGSLSQIDLWYDWPNGRNFNIILDQLDDAADTTYDLEWNNGTSFVYTPDGYCRAVAVGVGILRPDWLVDDSTYLGQRHIDGFLCNVWTKADFIWYYEDVATKRPVSWIFYTGRTIHVMTFEVGAVLQDAEWQAPLYCFNEKLGKVNSKLRSILDVDLWERHRHQSAF